MVGPSEIWRDLKNVILHFSGKTFLNVTYIFEGVISLGSLHFSKNVSYFLGRHKTLGPHGIKGGGGKNVSYIFSPPFP